MLACVGRAEAAPGALGVECDPAAPDACSAPLKRGEAAPYSGQLLTPILAVRLGQAAEHCADRTELEVTHTASVAAENLRHERQLRAIEVVQLTKERDAWERDAARWQAIAERRVEPPEWYEHPVVVGSAAVALSLLSILVAIEVVEAHQAAP